MRVSDIVSLFKEYMVLGIVAIIFLGILFWIGYKAIYQKMLHGKRTIQKRKMLLYSITICYAVIVLGAVFLNRGGIYGVANLHLFSSYKEAYHKMEISLFRNNILIILLFVPLGFLLPIYTDKLKKIYKVVPIGFLISLVIETVQYITKMGIFEIDDIFNNAVGVLLGYCVLMLFNCFRKKENKQYMIGYILPIIIAITIFGGIYIRYEKQELGNLPFEYHYKVNMKNVNIENNVKMKKERTNQIIYYTNTLTEEQTREMASDVFKRLGTQLSENDMDLYENTVIYYSTDREYNMWMQRKGGTYSYTDFSQFSSNKEEKIAKKKGATREEIEKALQRLGIEVPSYAKFEENEREYVFSINMDIQNDKLLNGNIICEYYEDGTIKGVRNNLVQYEKVKEKEVISEKEAYKKILEGKFEYNEHYYGKLQNLIIQNIELEYFLDTKGYYVPIYVFDAKINDIDTQINIRAIE